MTMLMAIALAQAQAQEVPSATPCTAALCDAARLRTFFDRLGEARRGRRTVRILQIGDSHTAADQITGSWRTLLQARYGSAGRGLLPPGRPYAGYLTRGITAAQSAGWAVTGIFGPAYHGGGGPPVGVSGYTLSGSDGATMSLSADAGELFDRFTVCALRQPGAGTLTLTAGVARQSVALDGPAPAPVCTSVTADAPTSVASLSVSGGPVSVTSWSTEASGGGGVILSNAGVVGAQLTHLGRADDAVVAAELEAYRPDLIVLAFGTNEAFAPKFSAAGYEATLRAGLARIRRLAPGVPILLLGAPDSSTRLAALQYGESGASPPCGSARLDLPGDRPPGDDGAPPMAQPLPPAPAPGGWLPTAALPGVQATQRRVAHATGATFWDWSMRMGGRCTANLWSRLAPPLMRGDHVHFTTPGAAEIARRLEDDLDAAMAGGERRP